TQFGVKTQEDIIVSKPIYEVSPILTNLKNWPHWFSNADKYEFRLINSNPAGINVQAKQAGARSTYSIAMYSDSVPSRTHIEWTTVISGFHWMKQKLGFASNDSHRSLEQLKRYFDNTTEFYGFDIKMGKVDDSLVLTKEAMIKMSELDTRLTEMFKALQHCARMQHLPANIDSCRMATFYDRHDDSIKVAAGIPVNSRVASLTDGIRLLEMPARGKMLIGKFRGPYKDLPWLYNAMRKYVFDKKLVVIGAPYQKFLSKGSSAQDSLDMTIELHFPVL
ncbi:MAG TPA: hypothetical protein VGR89_00060, partial [Puia sp.]|nr:hypothetical protein [Puia sp.]